MTSVVAECPRCGMKFYVDRFNLCPRCWVRLEKAEKEHKGIPPKIIE